MPARHHPLPEPTSAPPGSPEKVEVLARRRARGEELWHPDDCSFPVMAPKVRPNRVGGHVAPSGRSRYRARLFVAYGEPRRWLKVHLGSYASRSEATEAIRAWRRESFPVFASRAEAIQAARDWRQGRTANAYSKASPPMARSSGSRIT